ncbi:hypothetical protein Nmel_001676, partial [Mimus melanotis]
KREQEEAVGERESNVESPLSFPPQDEESEPAPTPPDGSLRDEEHSEPLLATLPKEEKIFGVFAMDEQDAAWMQAGCAQAAPPQEEPCEAGALAGACPVLAQALARSVPAGPAGSAAVLQPPAPRPWRSMAKTARRALRQLFSFSFLRGQTEE